MKSFNEIGEYLSKIKGFKVSVHYGNNYDDRWVYIPRIYHYNKDKAKIRVLTNKDNCKNCLKITFDEDKLSKKDIELLIIKYKKIIQLNLVGTCQNFLRVKDLTTILSEVYLTNNKKNPKIEYYFTN